MVTAPPPVRAFVFVAHRGQPILLFSFFFGGRFASNFANSRSRTLGFIGKDAIAGLEPTISTSRGTQLVNEPPLTRTTIGVALFGLKKMSSRAGLLNPKSSERDFFFLAKLPVFAVYPRVDVIVRWVALRFFSRKWKIGSQTQSGFCWKVRIEVFFHDWLS